MLFPLLSTAKTLLDWREKSPRECVYVCVLCVSYRSTEGDWQLRENKAVKMVIVHVQLFLHCSLQMLDMGRNPFSGQKCENKDCF